MSRPRKILLAVVILLASLVGVFALLPMILLQPPIPLAEVDAFLQKLEARNRHGLGSATTALEYNKLFKFLTQQSNQFEAQEGMSFQGLGYSLESGESVSEELRLAFSSSAGPVVEVFLALSELPHPQFLNPNDVTLTTDTFHISHFMDLFQLLDAEARFREQEGDIAGAFQLRARAIQARPLRSAATLIGALVDVGLVEAQLDGVAILIRNPELDLDAMRTLRLRLPELAPTVDQVMRAFRAECACSLRLLEDLDLDALDPMGPPQGSFLLGYGGMYMDHERAFLARTWMGFFERDTSSWQAVLAAAEAEYQALQSFEPQFGILGFVTQSWFDFIPTLPEKLGRAATRMNGLAVQLALEEYRRDRGGYPENLASLRALIGEIPDDPVSGKPFVYLRSGDDYELRSLGANGVDDGGGLDDVVIWPR